MSQPKYTNVQINISENQKQNLKGAMENGEPVSIHLDFQDLHGSDILAPTRSQVNRMTNAYQSGKGVTAKMSKAQLRYNIKEVQGEFLCALMGIASKVLPFLGKNSFTWSHQWNWSRNGNYCYK